MSFIAIATIIFSGWLCIGRPASILRSAPSAYMVLGLFAVLAILHITIDGVRWQMVPAYVLGSIGVALTLMRTYREQRATKLWLRLAGGAVLSVLGLIALLLPAALPVPKLPKPTGEFAVGMKEAVLDSDTARPILVRAWYPAQSDAARSAAPPYATEKEATALGAALTGAAAEDDAFVADHFRTIELHASTDAEPAAGAFPALVFSHGYSGLPNQSMAVVQELVSRGWVVLAVGHHGGAAGIEYPDGTFSGLEDIGLSRINPEEAIALLKRMQQAESSRELTEAVAKIRALTAQIEEVAAQWSSDQQRVLDALSSGALDNLVPNVDKAQIGMFGHSFGGSASMLTCARDERCDAAANLDGMQYGNAQVLSFPAPILMIYTDHPNAGLLYNDAAYHWSEQDRAVIVSRSSHQDPTDLAFAVSPLLKRMLGANPVLGSIDANEGAHTFAELLDAFFAEHLKAKGDFDATIRDLRPVELHEVPASRHRPQAK